MNSWKDYVRKVIPYTPGEQPNKPNMIKLNTNENPYPPAPGVAKVINNMDADRLRLYPDPTIKGLVEELAKAYGLDNDQVFVGVGSDDVISLIYLTFFNSDKAILFPDITYSFYPVWADVYGVSYERPKLDENFMIIKEDYYKENGGIILANPNAPTSIYESLDVIEDIILHNRDSIVVIDEAYIDFAGESAVKLINKYDNLLVVQTFSKSRSMAGMRIGYVMANKKLIQYIDDVKHSINSYTLNYASILAGIESVKDKEYFANTNEKIIKTRKTTEKFLREYGFTFPKPSGNFIFARHENVKALDIFEALKANDIYVRYFNHDRIDNYLRITIGTDEEMEELRLFLKKYLNR